MAVKRRHFPGCPANSAFNVRASLRKESWGEALVARSFQVTARSWSVRRSHSNRPTTVAGEEKHDACACVSLELTQALDITKNLPGGAAELVDGSSRTQHTRDRERAGRQHEHSWPLPRSVGVWQLRHNFPSPQPMPEPGLHIAALTVLMPLMLPAVFYDSGEGLLDEGINYALGTINHLWLPCYVVLQVLR